MIIYLERKDRPVGCFPDMLRNSIQEDITKRHNAARKSAMVQGRCSLSSKGGFEYLDIRILSEGG